MRRVETKLIGIGVMVGEKAKRSEQAAAATCDGSLLTNSATKRVGLRVYDLNI